MSAKKVAKTIAYILNKSKSKFMEKKVENFCK